MKNLPSRIILLLTLALSLGLLTTSPATAVSLADVGLSGVNIGGEFGSNFQNPGTTINFVISLILFVAGVAAFLYILWGAFNYVTAGDSSDKTTKARTTITNAVVGLILVALSYVIWTIVMNVTGLGAATDLTTTPVPSQYEQDNIGEEGYSE